MANRKQFVHNNPVIEVLNEWLEAKPEYNLVEIAERIGVTKSANCFMSQIRAGRSKLPVSKIVPLAQLLEQDPKPLVNAVLDEYYPELKDALVRSDLLKTAVLPSKDLRELVTEKKQTA